MGITQFSSVHFISVQLLSRVQLFVAPWTAARQATLSITNSWSLLKLMSTESVMPSNHLIYYSQAHIYTSTAYSCILKQHMLVFSLMGFDGAS